ncbi:MocR-like pyridoxine biosynthesis transcription factor PdxR [Neobacillus sp. D3-1R]|uniref:MocR-like pyridoxine biosynthesis transcription factor PdxR n=1 Tax=Neobacillus sp. D3-1R TaxID=3445778 RepID=UPI003F9ED523
MDRTPFLNSKLRIPLYVQLYEYFKEEVESGRILENTKLPSIRQLALHLKISRNTVETAYQQLIAEGYVESRPKSGVIVLKMETKVSTPEKDKVTEEIVTTEKKSFIDFQYGDIEVEKFPMREWRRSIVNAVSYSNEALFTYGDKQGHHGLRKEIASYLFEARGIDCDASEIVLCAGTQQSILLVSYLLELFNEKVAMEEPGYDGVRSVFEKHHCNIESIPLEHDGVNIQKVKSSKAKALYLTPSHQFPLGMVLSISKRKTLLEWANEENSYLIEDDYDSEFRYIGQPIPSLKSLDSFERVIYLGTFSKAFLPAARVSYIVLPKVLIHKYKEEYSFLHQAISPIIQEALYQFMKNGEFAKHIRKMRKTYQSKHKKLNECLHKYLGEHVTIIGQKAGLHLLIQIKNQKVADLILKAEKAGVKVYPAHTFWKGKVKTVDESLMLGYGGLSEAEIEDGVIKLKRAWLG